MVLSLGMSVSITDIARARPHVFSSDASLTDATHNVNMTTATTPPPTNPIRLADMAAQCEGILEIGVGFSFAMMGRVAAIWGF